MKKIRVGINGLGRIGRTVLRMILEHDQIEVAGVNDLLPAETLAHLIKYDTVHGVYKSSVGYSGNTLLIGEKIIPVSHADSPSDIPCRDWKVDIVIESSGKFKKKEQLKKIIEAGAHFVILSCPSEDSLDKTVIMGVNDSELTSGHKIISNASCTSNCVCALLHVIQKEIGIESAFLNTVHPATGNQNLTDGGHSDLRRARAAYSNIIPTTSSAINAILEVMPELKGKFDGIATRVPVLDGALAEIVVVLKRKTDVSELNNIVRNSAEGYMKNIIAYCGDPIVSSDIIGRPESCIFDPLMTKVINSNTAQLISWYDNEYGYSGRIVDLIIKIGSIK
ncbi:MAG TPA: type I glyceraldehyde-3-phosphate dehydrogenase [Clostridiales bacterium]|jgi:glyceraldehyde 3-phosphate dehydrogenase|nr:type I glyceraldehyde-3-phosphate dehydrogenase [Clostridiales bacterium]HQP69265.1 type I glyceraldehyde-3-phosphate dehydrogenase [Clostridiales bacterium]